MKKKKLVIISGITGAIGNAFLCKYSREENTVIYGISRKAENINEFIDKETGKLFPATFIADIEGLKKENILSLVDNIDYSFFESVTYVHLLGLYPFEVNKKGEITVENDKDGDGINDNVLELSYRVFKNFTEEIHKHTKKENIDFALITMGGIADKYKPMAHQSWWRVKEINRDWMKSIASDSTGLTIIDICSVVCSHEIITRPHVFVQTDAYVKYWIFPHEIVDRFFKKVKGGEINVFKGFSETEIFNIKPGFDLEYYENFKFTPRKVKEIYHK